MLQSYMSTLIAMSLSMGLMFEMPVLCWLFGKLGLLTMPSCVVIADMPS